METLLSSLALCSWAFLLGMQRKISLLYAPFIVLSLAILIAYVGGYAHILPSIKIIFIYGGLIACIAALALCYTRRHELQKDDAWKEECCIFVGFTVLILFYNWYYIGSHITSWDEFFQAAFVKALFYEHGFWTLATPLARSEVSMTYPPMTSLLVWLFQPLKSYTEAAFGVSTMAFFLSVACLLYSFARQQLSICTSLLLTFVMTIFLRVIGAVVIEFYLPGYVDSIQGGLFALVLCTMLFLQENKQRLFVFTLGMLLLSLCKSTGIVLCLYVSCALALQRLLQDLHLKKNILPACAWGCTSFALAFAPYFCWKIYVKIHFSSIEQTGAMLDFAKHISDPLFWPALLVQLQAFYDQKLIHTPFGELPPWLTSTSTFLLLISFGVLWAQRKGRDWQYIFTWQCALSFCGLMLWIGLHFYAFFIFASEDRIMVAGSFNRYAGAFINGIWGTFFLLFISYAIGEKWRKIVLSSVSVLVIVFAFFPLERPVHAKEQHVSQKMYKAAAYIAQHTPKNTLTLYVPNISVQAPEAVQHQEVWALRYFLAPERKAVYPYMLNMQPSLGRPKRIISPLPSKEAFLQKVHDIRADYIFINENSVLERYSDYFLLCQYTVPCLIPVMELKN